MIPTLSQRLCPWVLAVTALASLALAKSSKMRPAEFSRALDGGVLADRAAVGGDEHIDRARIGKRGGRVRRVSLTLEPMETVFATSPLQ